MKPYLAIITDSFREAFASRVLWVVLVGCTLLLAATLPATLHEHLGAKVGPEDLVKPARLLAQMRTAATSDPNSPDKRIWDRLPADFRGVWSRPQDEEALLHLPAALATALNQVIKTDDLYDPDVWPSVSPTSEAGILMAQGKLSTLSEDQRRRLNRLLIEAVYPAYMLPSRPTEVDVYLMGNEYWSNVRVPKATLLAEVLSLTIDFFMGTLGVFVAVLVTSSLIPQTFESGSIDLLLSKPVSRSAVFLTRFVGGCAFIMIAAAYLVVGLWLIAGLWHEWWCHEILWTLPVFVLLFAIYFSVSALSGLLWRNAIVSVAITVLFWGLCWSVKFAHKTTLDWGLNPGKFVRVTDVGGDVVAVNQQGQFLVWNPAESSWEEIFQPTQPEIALPVAIPRQPVVGPIYDPRHNRMLAIVHPLPFPPRAPTVSSGQAESAWVRVEGATVPDRTRSMFLQATGKLLAVNQRGIFRSKGEPVAGSQTGNLFGLQVPLPSSGRFEMISKDLRLSRHFAAAYDAKSEEIAIFDAPRMLRLTPDADGRYEIANQMETDRIDPGLIGRAGGSWIVAQFDGTIEFRDAQFKLGKTFQPVGEMVPRQVSCSDDGRLAAVVFHSGACWLYDTEQNKDISARLRENSEVGAVSFNEGNIYVANRYTRVSRYSRDSLEVKDTLHAESDFVEQAFRWILDPLFTVLPKPGQLGGTINQLLKERDTQVTVGEQRIDAQWEVFDLWGPVRDGLIFTSVMLALGCWYVSRKDF